MRIARFPACGFDYSPGTAKQKQGQIYFALLKRSVPVVMSFPAIQAAFDALYPQGACGDNHEGLAQVKN
jgi:hypothetical protein